MGYAYVCLLQGHLGGCSCTIKFGRKWKKFDALNLDLSYRAPLFAIVVADGCSVPLQNELPKATLGPCEENDLPIKIELILKSYPCLFFSLSYRYWAISKSRKLSISIDLSFGM